MGKLLERLVILVTALLLVLGLSAVLGTGGPVGDAIVHWKQARRARASLAGHWSDLVAASGRVDSRGDSVVVIEFADYQCPFCRQAEGQLALFRAAHPHIGIGFIQFPLAAVHPAAEGAAIASLCAGEQGRFRDMHGRLMTTEAWEQDRDWAREARAAGVHDMGAFRHCLSDSSVAFSLARDISLGQDLGIKATPSFVTRHGIQEGFLGPDSLLARLSH